MSMNGKPASTIEEAIDDEVLNAAQRTYSNGRVLCGLDEDRAWRKALGTGVRAVVRRLGFQRRGLPAPHIDELLDVFERQRDLHLRGLLATKMLSRDEIVQLREVLRSADEAAIRNALQVHDGWRELRRLERLEEVTRARAEFASQT